MGARDERRARIQASIEEAALQLFVERGFDDVSIEAIAGASGVSRATVFRYYPNKESILFANWPRDLERLAALLDARPEARNSIVEFRDAVREFANSIESEGDSFRQRSSVAMVDERLNAIALGVRERAARTISKWLSDGAKPSLRQEVLSVVAVESLVLGVRHWRAAATPKPLREHVDEAFEAILQLSSEGNAPS